MTADDAAKRATELNISGQHRARWVYYATHLDKGLFAGSWCVLRRLKDTQVGVAVFADGRLTSSEIEENYYDC